MRRKYVLAVASFVALLMVRGALEGHTSQGFDLAYLVLVFGVPWWIIRRR